jgi:hypothetical protein
VAGEYEGKKGAASTFSPMHVYNITLKEGGEIPLGPPLTSIPLSSLLMEKYWSTVRQAYKKISLS